MALKVGLDFSFISSNKSNITLHEIISHDQCLLEVYLGMMVLAIVFLPFNICALWHGRTTLTTHKACNLSDVLNFNLIIASLVLSMPPIFIFIFILYPSRLFLFTIGNIFTNACLQAQTQFHTWICMEQYVAVVYPILYLKLKQFRYGAVLVSFTWALSLVFGIVAVQCKFGIYVFLIPISGFLLTILFCSVLTLATLRQSSPGGRTKEMHLKKLKAFKIITVTLMVLIIRFCPHICVTILVPHLPFKTVCVSGSISLSLLHFGSIFHLILYIFRFTKKPCNMLV